MAMDVKRAAVWAWIALMFIFSGGYGIIDGQPVSGNSITTPMAVMTYVAFPEQERSVRALIRSIRQWGGDYSESMIYVVLPDASSMPCLSLKGPHVELVALQIDSALLEYPLAIKAFAAARVESLVSDFCQCLVWFDPGVLVLGPPEGVALGTEYDAALRPVTLANTIGLPPGAEPNDYWRSIYDQCGLDYRSLPIVETIADTVKIQPYYNCEVYSINPRLGICREWAAILTEMLRDEMYQQKICASFLRRLFLHQAVLSAVVTAKIPTERIKSLPLTSGYPFNQHSRLPVARQIAALDDLSVVIFDDAWERNPAWMNAIPIQEPLRQWLFDAYLDYLKIGNHLYRIEGSCNSYLITTPRGSALIDPAGAAVAPEYFQKLIESFPLKAILLTHAHQDHSDDIAKWRGANKVAVIAQREFKDYFDYQDELSGLFQRRNAIWAGKPDTDTAASAPSLNSRNEPTILFADDYTYELGGIHFKLIHTPGETPDQTTIWAPELGAVFVGDNYYEYFINNSTFRGTQIRPVNGYIHALDTALSFQPHYFLPGHGTPLIGRDQVQKTVGNFRDALKYVYDETIKGINEGKDVYTLMQTVRLPETYRIGQYYGKVAWTVRGIWQETIGWFDENPASMYALPVSGIYADLVELAGADVIAARADSLQAAGEYLKTLHLTDIVLNVEPGHKQALEVRLRALESLKKGTYNYIERIWLNYGIRHIRERMND